MSSLRHIKAKIGTIESYLRSNNAMKSVASVRISKYKKKIKLLKLVESITQNFRYSTKKEEEKKTLEVIIGCNQGMCGSFLSNVSNYIKKQVKEISDNEYIHVLGEKFLEYNLHVNINTEKIVSTSSGFLNTSKNIYNFIQKNNITDINFHYSDSNKIIKKEVIKERDINSKYCIYEMLWITVMIMEAVYTSGFYENKERVLALEQAKTNAEKMQKKAYNELNRIRQDTITNDLAEIIAGVLL